jgi:hypothetical protein
MSKSVIAVYKDDLLANQAVLDLHRHGFSPKAILVAEWPINDPKAIMDLACRDIAVPVRTSPM